MSAPAGLRCSICADSAGAFWIADDQGIGIERPCDDCLGYAVRTLLDVHGSIIVKTREQRISEVRAACEALR